MVDCEATPGSDDPQDEQQWDAFQDDLQALLNKHCIDNKLGTPDFLLASNLVLHLQTQQILLGSRDRWHGFENHLNSTLVQAVTQDEKECK
jgi:hypothetical protein